MAVNTDLAASSPAPETGLGILSTTPAVLQTPAAAPSATPKPESLVIAGKTLPISEVETLIPALQEEVKSLKDELQWYSELSKVVNALNPQNLAMAQAYVNQLATAQANGQSLSSADPKPFQFVPPEGFERIKSSDMMNETATVYEALLAESLYTRGMLLEMSKAMGELQQHSSQVLALSTDQKMAEDLSKKYGATITVEWIQNFRKQGGGDPSVALQILYPGKTATEATPGLPKPPEPPADSIAKGYDVNAIDPETGREYYHNVQKMADDAAMGIWPNNPEDAAELRKRLRMDPL